MHIEMLSDRIRHSVVVHTERQLDRSVDIIHQPVVNVTTLISLTHDIELQNLHLDKDLVLLVNLCCSHQLEKLLVIVAHDEHQTLIVQIAYELFYRCVLQQLIVLVSLKVMRLEAFRL